ncbi:protein-disulfide reductase DsbD domain-containing protein [Methylobacterium oryzae CBMB20]
MIRRLAILILALRGEPLGRRGAGFPAGLPHARRTSCARACVAEPAAVAGAQPFTLAVRMQVKPGWHVYWRNPGDSGPAPGGDLDPAGRLQRRGDPVAGAGAHPDRRR